MKPYPFELLNHFTVPRTSLALLNGDIEIWHPGAGPITLTPLKIRLARSVPETKFESIEHSSFIANISLPKSGYKNDSVNFSGFCVSAGRETGNKKEFRRWIWRRAVSRPGSSLPVACGCRLGRLFSHPLPALLRLPSALPPAG